MTSDDMGVSENVGYIPNDSHLVGVMISKTIGFRGLAYFQTHPHGKTSLQPETMVAHQGRTLDPTCALVEKRGLLAPALAEHEPVTPWR